MSEFKDFDLFWLEKGQELVKNTMTNLNKHLTNYSTYLKFLQGFYALIGLASAALSTSVNPYIYISYLLPLIIVYIAFFQISVGQSIPLEQLDLRSPLKINKVYNQLAYGLKADILKAKKWVGLATFAVLIGGSVTVYLLNTESINTAKAKAIEDAKKQQSETLFKAKNEIDKAYEKTQKLHFTVNDNNQKITIEATLSESKTYLITYLDVKDTKQVVTIKIPKQVNYKREISNVKHITDIQPIELKN